MSLSRLFNLDLSKKLNKLKLNFKNLSFLELRAESTLLLNSHCRYLNLKLNNKSKIFSHKTLINLLRNWKRSVNLLILYRLITIVVLNSCLVLVVKMAAWTKNKSWLRATTFLNKKLIRYFNLILMFKMLFISLRSNSIEWITKHQSKEGWRLRKWNRM